MCSDVRPTACNFLIGVFGFRDTGTKFSVSFVLLFCLRKKGLFGRRENAGRKGAARDEQNFPQILSQLFEHS